MSVLLITALLAVQPAATPSAANSADPNKKICKVKKDNTGSRMSKRMCLTQTEWDKRDAGVTANDLKNVGGR